MPTAVISTVCKILRVRVYKDLFLYRSGPAKKIAMCLLTRCSTNFDPSLIRSQLPNGVRQSLLGTIGGGKQGINTSSQGAGEFLHLSGMFCTLKGCECQSWGRNAEADRGLTGRFPNQAGGATWYLLRSALLLGTFPLKVSTLTSISLSQPDCEICEVQFTIQEVCFLPRPPPESESCYVIFEFLTFGGRGKNRTGRPCASIYLLFVRQINLTKCHTVQMVKKLNGFEH